MGLTCGRTMNGYRLNDEQDLGEVTKGTKKKAIPLQTWAGPEVSKSLKLPDFKTIGTWRW